MIDKVLIIKEIMKVYGFDKKGDFADFLGINQQVLSNWIKRNTFDIDLIFTKCDKINADYLLTGNGEMLKKAVNYEAKEFYNQVNEPKPTDYIVELQNKLIKSQDVQIATLQMQLNHCLDQKKTNTIREYND